MALKKKTAKKTGAKAATKARARKKAASSQYDDGPFDWVYLPLDWFIAFFKWSIKTVAAGFSATRASLSDNRVRLFCLVFLFALVSRLWTPDWYKDRQFHPDERWLFDKTSQLSYIEKSNDFPYLKFGMPGEAGGDPAGLQYGSLPLYIVATVKDFKMMFTGQGVHDVIKPLARRVTGLVDSLSVLLIFILGAILWDRRVGLLAATLLAFTPLHIQLAHFFTVDPYMTFFMLLTLIGCAKLLKAPSWKISALTGVALGATFASKTSAIPLAGVVALAHWFTYLKNRPADKSRRGAYLAKTAIGLGIAGGASAAAFTIFMPHWILSFDKFYQNQDSQRRMLVVGSPGGTPFVRQFWDTLPIIYHLKNIFLYYQWIPLATISFFAFAWQVVRPALGLAGLGGAEPAQPSPPPPLQESLPVKRAAKKTASSIKKKIPVAVQEQSLPAWFDPGMVLLLAWIILYMAVVGFSFAKFARYMLPATATLALVAAATLVRFKPPAGFKRLAWTIMTLVAVVLSFGYASGYLASFNRTHPWIAASDWMFNNVQRMTVDAGTGQSRRTRILNESWGDDLPVQTEKGNAGNFDNQKLNIVEWDKPWKLTHLGDQLSWTDIVVMADARAYGTYLRLPHRFPLTHSYFQLMFTDPGRLGFERAADFHNKVKAFGIEINDTRNLDRNPFSWADESWSMYDRPHTFLFRKVKPLDSAQIQAQLADHVKELGLSDAWRLGKSPEELHRMAVGGDNTQTAGNVSAAQPQVPAEPNVNLGQSRGELRPLGLSVLTWWVLITVLGWLVLPLAAMVFKSYPDGGWALSRAMGLLLFSWLAFTIVSVTDIPYYQSHLWGLLAGLAALSVFFTWRHKAAAAAWLKPRFKTILWSEAVFAVAFLFFVTVRFFNPHIHDIMSPGYFGGGEPLGMTYLSAVTRCADFPVFDPWLSGASSSYYYFGYVLAATMTKLSGHPPGVTYNLSLALFFSLTVLSAYGIGLALTGKKRFALVAGLAVAAFGSLWTAPYVSQWISGQAKNIFMIPVEFFAAIFSRGFIWDPTRFPGLVPGAIYEFPFFSYLYSDLHPHNIALPFSLVLLGLFLAPFASAKKGLAAFGENKPAIYLWIFLTALFLDTQYAINTWSWPVLLAVGLVASPLAGWVGRQGSWQERLKASAIGMGLFVGTVALGYLVLMRPFREHFIQDGGQRLHWLPLPDRKMPFYQTLAFYFFGFLGLAAMVGQRLKSWWDGMDNSLGWRSLWVKGWEKTIDTLPERILDREQGRLWGMGTWLAIVSTLMVLAVAGVSNGQALWFALACAVICLGCFCLQREMDGREAFVWALAFATLAMVTGSEIWYVNDRMNTIFKFWFNGWIFFGLIFAYGFWKTSNIQIEAPFKNVLKSAGAKKKKSAKKKSARRGGRASKKAPVFPWARLLGPAIGIVVFLSLFILAHIDQASGNASHFAVSSIWLGILLLLAMGAAFMPFVWGRPLWKALFVALLVFGLLYPFGASIARIVTTSRFNDHFRGDVGFFDALSRSPGLTNPTIDGLEFLRTARPRGVDRSARDYDSHDGALVDWLNTNADKTEVLLEAPGSDLYKGLSRYAIYTGLPTMLGWKYQVGQQLGNRTGNQLNQRESDANKIYSTADEEEAIRLLDKYEVRWIVVGGIERRIYGEAGLAKFTGFCKAVKKDGDSVLYRYEGRE